MRLALFALSSLVVRSLRAAPALRRGLVRRQAQTTAMPDSLEAFCGAADASWLRCLNEDPEAAANAPNKRSREVKSGHYVRVAPTPLRAPGLAMHSPELAADLGLDAEAVASAGFAEFFGGDHGALPFPAGESWATPYALSIMGEPQTRNCPFGTGNGYGDGRAVSVGEIKSPKDGRRYELQLKGGGQTPFCRGADGRAVLRSSLREFLASEAMHFLGVETTRALSLVVSGGETTRRPWYSGRQADVPEVSEDDPRLAQFPLQLRRQLIRQLQQQGAGGGDPDVMVEETCAITCRVAPSFVRVGHVDHFARRAGGRGAAASAKREHKLMVQHAIAREYPELLLEHRDETDATMLALVGDDELKTAALAFAARARDALALLAAGWLRVGFCQGNFNADNCLVGGRTMDYGPFGFMDKYDPSFAKWVGSGDHFAFAAQPGAALANFRTLAKALLPLFEDDPAPLMAIIDGAKATFADAMAECYGAKLGFADPGSAAARKSWLALEPSLRGLDYTIFFRQLGAVARADDDDLLAYVEDAFYADPSPETAKALRAWLAAWKSGLGDAAAAAARLDAANPKYVLREWMLVEAYEAAKRGDFSVAHELHGLVKAPYDEHDGLAAKYYRRAPDAALTKPGTAFMT